MTLINLLHCCTQNTNGLHTFYIGWLGLKWSFIDLWHRVVVRYVLVNNQCDTEWSVNWYIYCVACCTWIIHNWKLIIWTATFDMWMCWNWWWENDEIKLQVSKQDLQQRACLRPMWDEIIRLQRFVSLPTSRGSPFMSFARIFSSTLSRIVWVWCPLLKLFVHPLQAMK